MSQCHECKNELVPGTAVKSGSHEFCNHLCRVLFERRARTDAPRTSESTSPRAKSMAAKWLWIGASVALTFAVGSLFGRKVVELLIHRKPGNMELNALASELNTRLPMMLDNETQLKTSIAIDGRIRYVYKLVRADGGTIDKSALLTKVTNQATAMSCSNAETRSLIDKDVDLEYWYMDKSDRFILSYVLTKSACEELDKNR